MPRQYIEQNPQPLTFTQTVRLIATADGGIASIKFIKAELQCELWAAKRIHETLVLEKRP